MREPPLIDAINTAVRVDDPQFAPVVRHMTRLLMGGCLNRGGVGEVYTYAAC
jgi:hypothetical protein